MRASARAPTCTAAPPAPAGTAARHRSPPARVLAPAIDTLPHRGAPAALTASGWRCRRQRPERVVRYDAQPAERLRPQQRLARFERRKDRRRDREHPICARHGLGFADRFVRPRGHTDFEIPAHFGSGRNEAATRSTAAWLHDLAFEGHGRVARQRSFAPLDNGAVGVAQLKVGKHRE
eukprot:66492-Prymnesium_polylepis.2